MSPIGAPPDAITDFTLKLASSSLVRRHARLEPRIAPSSQIDSPKGGTLSLFGCACEHNLMKCRQDWLVREEIVVPVRCSVFCSVSFFFLSPTAAAAIVVVVVLLGH